MKLHETIKNFYIKKLRPIFSVEVLSQNGRWNSVKSFNVTEKQFFYRVKTENTVLLCTENHILIDENDEEVLAVKALGKKIKTTDGIEKVVDVQKTNIYDHAYDLSLAENTDHLYYANKMLSHNCVICDEFAFLQRNLADKLFTSMFPVISSSKNGKFIIVSTPNGTDNLYYDIWQKANSKDKDKNLDGWAAFTMWWWQVPGHDEAWKKRQIEAIGATRFAQEFNNEFLAAATTRKLVPDDIIEKYRRALFEHRTQIKPKKQVIMSVAGDKAYEFTVWKSFSPDRVYAASADTAEGVGGDSSVLYIWDVTDLRRVEMCAKFSSNTVSLVEFAYVCSKMLPLYGNPWLFAERNGVSAGMLDSLRITYGYQNIAVESKSGEPGIYSHVTVKSRACLWTKDMVTTDGFGFVIYDKDLVDEMGTFVKKDSKGPAAVFHSPRPAHDDHMMTFVWLCYALQNDVVEKYFVVVQNFTSQLDQIYPRLLQPAVPYDFKTIDRIRKDPLYQDFLDFQRESTQTARQAMTLVEQANTNDMYKYTDDDMYFGGSWDGGSWNDPGRSSSLNPNNHMPVYFI